MNHIRRARLMDGHQLCLMMQKFLRERKVPKREGTLTEAEKFLALFNLKYNDKEWIFFVAEIDQKIAGFISGHMVGWDVGYSGKMGYVQYLYVKKDYRNKGLGNKLVQSIYAEMEANKVGEIQMQIVYDEHLMRRYSKEGKLAQSGFTPMYITMRKDVSHG